MGAGISPAVLRGRKYRSLKRIARELTAKGIDCEYQNLEVRGTKFVVYYAGIGPASNGEQCCWLVLRFNPDHRPDANAKRPGDVDYSDFHKRDIPEFSRGGWDAGIKKLLEVKT